MTELRQVAGEDLFFWKRNLSACLLDPEEGGLQQTENRLRVRELRRKVQDELDRRLRSQGEVSNG